MKTDIDVAQVWDKLAEDWEIQVGDDGDINRRANSDPYLWNYAGDVKSLKVLDVGCGNGYLCRKLTKKGAITTGVDVSPEMIKIAAKKNPDLHFQVDSATELSSIESNSFDLLIANYVLMDVPDFEAAVSSFFRVLKPGGKAILVFSHPCFPQAWAEHNVEKNKYSYHWAFSYFERKSCESPPWDHFRSEFLWFHRPLSDYWKAFKKAGFTVSEFDEPRMAENSEVAREIGRKRSLGLQKRPFSVIFKLEKPVN